jgi:hypothetical protein
MTCPSCVSLVGLAFLLVDRFGELLKVGVERSQESLDGEPLDTTSASLDPRDVCGVHLDALGKLLLSDAGCVSQATKRTAKKAQLGVAVGLAHRHLGIPGQVAVSSATQKIVGARADRTAGRRGTESANSRRASQASSLPAWLPRPEQSSRGLQPKEEPMSTTNPQGVLSSLLAEDRPWTVEEMIREKGNRLEVVDAIAELHAAGLVTRINKHVICASRAAIRADELSL